MSKIIIIGGTGTAICIAEQIIDAKNKYNGCDEFIGWSIDDESLGEEISGYPVLCKTQEAKDKYSKYDDVKFIFALYKPGVMKHRIKLLNSYGILKEKFATFIHPTAYIANSVIVDTGSIVLSHSSINSNVLIGKNNIINTNVVIEHDTILGDNNFLASSVCLGSSVKIGKGSFIGLNSTIRENIEISDYSFVGMGSNVLKNIAIEQTVFGNPAK